MINRRDSRVRRDAGVALFLVGLLLAQALAIASFWPDMEASLFDPSVVAEERLNTLRCPVLLAKGETAEISARFSNPADRPLRFFARAHISEGGTTIIREIEELLDVAPGETKRVSWEVDADNAAFGRLVLARVSNSRRFPVPARDKACGMLVMPVTGITGAQMFWITIGASLLSIGLGVSLWLMGKRPLSDEDKRTSRVLGILGGLILLDLFVSLMTWWLGGLLLLVLIVLLLGAMFERYFLSL